MKPKVTLVGAGPGAVDLITLRGLNALKSASVVLYDALANQELLKFTKSSCIHVFVGKRYECHSYKQDQINELLVSYAFKYGDVLRLKGGDPIVFGRATEELEYLQMFGIDTEVISGVSSCIAVPTSQGIPVTKRGLSESFWVLTGHNKSKGLPKDIYLAAQSSATVVILMGLNKLNEIVEIFKSYGKSKMPIAIIQNGTCYDERYVVANIDDIQDRLNGIYKDRPSVIVIGEVVGVHKDYVFQYGSELIRA